jgi:hypothetical protein
MMKHIKHPVGMALAPRLGPPLIVETARPTTNREGLPIRPRNTTREQQTPAAAIRNHINKMTIMRRCRKLTSDNIMAMVKKRLSPTTMKLIIKEARVGN